MTIVKWKQNYEETNFQYFTMKTNNKVWTYMTIVSNSPHRQEPCRLTGNKEASYADIYEALCFLYHLHVGDLTQAK